MMASLASCQEKQGKIHLLDLPFEILQLIAWHLDVATFYIWLPTCKKLMHASKDRRIIVHQLRDLPGLLLDCTTMSTLQLWDLFRKRAAESLCGAGVLADIKSYTSSHIYRRKPGSGRLRLNKPVFSLASPPQIAMADDFGIVRVFTLDDRGIRLTSELHPTSELHASSANLDEPHDMAVLKMAFSSSNGLAVLYRLSEPTKTLDVSPFYQRGQPVPLVVVIYLPKLSPTGEISYSTEEYEPILIPDRDGAECISLAVAPNGNVCLGWIGLNLSERTHFWIVSNKFRNASIGMS